MKEQQTIELLKITSGMSIQAGFEAVQCKINEMIIAFAIQQKRGVLNMHNTGLTIVEPVVADDLTVTPYLQIKLVKEKINELIESVNQLAFRQEGLRHELIDMMRRIGEDVGNMKGRIAALNDTVRYLERRIDKS